MFLSLAWNGVILKLCKGLTDLSMLSPIPLSEVRFILVKGSYSLLRIFNCSFKLVDVVLPSFLLLLRVEIIVGSTAPLLLYEKFPEVDLNS